MPEWNPGDPESWSKTFGLVGVPLFGPKRNDVPPGTHALMLDGSAGSFALSIDESPSSASDDSAMGWAWSSNVRHSVVVDLRTYSAISRRWDSPDDFAEWSLDSVHAARRLLRGLESSRVPIAGETVIERALHTFSAIRLAVESRGGTALDVVLAFNALLAWTAARRGSSLLPTSFAEAVSILQRDREITFSADDLSGVIRSYPLIALAELLRGRDSMSPPYLLDADLLVRHASGTLYQEAHRLLLREPLGARQLNLFQDQLLIPAGPEPLRALPPSYVHHTPPSLARALVETGLFVLKRENGLTPISVFDPACGSGVFLIETIRDLVNHPKVKVSLRGSDSSSIATAMAEFCLLHATRDLAQTDCTFEIRTADSLATNWPESDIILMNPPFRAWETLADSERADVRTALGKALTGRPDVAFAFVHKALLSLSPGGVLATIVPASFLSGKSAERIRAFLTKSCDYQVRLIGLFRGYRYFEDATVEPAFLVASRSRDEHPVRIVTAEYGHEERAIRAMRSMPGGHPVESDNVELYSVPLSELSEVNWTPRPRHIRRLLSRIAEKTTTRVQDTFVVHLGVRVGNKQALVLSNEDFRALSEGEQRSGFFRPIADRIRRGRIRKTGYLFYPYSEEGNLIIATETGLAETVPRFYRQHLLPHKEQLRNRRSLRHRKWWEPSEPVATWLARRESRIVSQEFGRKGNFALDAKGRCAVVQGHGWFWNGESAPSMEILYGYLALLNSRVFDQILGGFCNKLQGGQYVLRRQYVERAPFPRLEGGRTTRKLARIGKRIHAGQTYDEDRLDVAVTEAYGIADVQIASYAVSETERRFRKLARQWTRDTALYSFIEQKKRHPAYSRIVDMGEIVVPLLLREMRDRPGFLANALAEITGADPIPEREATIEDVANAWVQWGRRNGYDI
jgi:adenine-specific DNA-methyltransferase